MFFLILFHRSNYILGLFRYVFSSQIFSQIRAAFLSASYAILLGFSFLKLTGLNLILYTLINFLLLYLLHRTKWYTACFHAIILSALMAACEILPIGILSVFTPNFLHHYDIFPYSLIFVIFSKGLFLLLLIFLSFL